MKDEYDTSSSEAMLANQRRSDSADEEPFLPQERMPIEHLYTAGCCRRRRLYYAMVAVLLILSGTLLAFITWGLVMRHAPMPPSRHTEVIVSPCGSTAAEARARSCHFDIMSFCWLPDRCYDAELSAEFASQQNWQWYQDRQKEHPVSEEVALSGDHGDLWVDNEYHMLHCTYMWRKMHRALMGEGKRTIDSYIANYTHTGHCEHMLMKGSGVDLEHVNTIIQVKFPDCGMP